MSTHSEVVQREVDDGALRLFAPLDELDAGRLARHLVAYTPSDGELLRLFAAAQEELGTLIDMAVIRRVASANPDVFTAFSLRRGYDVTRPRADGFIAWLPLTEAGCAALLDGGFAPADPAPAHLAGQHDAPAAIYLWALYAPGRLAAGISWAMQRWSTPACRAADIYTRPVTPAGLAFVRRIGFAPRANAGTGLGALYVFRRSRPAAPRPLYDSYPSATQRHTVTVVRTHDDLARVLAIRSAAFLSDQSCPYAEEFDGNDFSSTHLLGFAGDEPAACLRVRCFATFAKVERLVVLPTHRTSPLAFRIVKAAHALCQMKGSRLVYGHAQKRLVDFWSRAGARPFPGAREFVFSDFEYVEMLAQITPHPDAIAVGSDPYVIVRPEGRWHEPGVLERSAARPASSPLRAADQRPAKARRTAGG